MMRWLLPYLLAALLLANIAPGLAPRAQAQPETASDASREQARRRFAQGVEAYEAGAYPEALEAFEAAYRLAPHPQVRVNIANCHEQLGDSAAALFHFERFLVEAEDASAAQRRDVRAAIVRLQPLVARVEIDTEPSHATVSIDGRELPHAPGEPHYVAVGRRQVEASAPGYLTEQRTLNIEGSAPLRLNLILRPESSAPEPGPLASPAPPNNDRDDEPWLFAPLEPLTVAVGGATAATIIAAVVVGLLAVDAESSFEESNRRAADPSLSPTQRLLAFNQAVSDADRANDLSLTADILGTVGAVAAAGTAFLVVWDILQAEDDNSSEDPDALTLVPHLQVSDNQLGARLQLGF